MSNSGNLAIRKKSLLAFVHIEKACGTTLHHIFRNNMPLSYAHIRPKGSWKDDSLRVWQVNEAVALLKKVGFTYGNYLWRNCYFTGKMTGDKNEKWRYFYK